MKIVFVFCIAILNIAKSQDLPTDDVECPDDGYGLYPISCTCSNGEYDEGLNKCINSICPTNSTGTYPNCKCTEKNFDYSRDVNDCFRVCPENSTGYWPKCVCDDKNQGFVSSRFECISCPSDSKYGNIYPNCDCGKNGTYDKHKNQCPKCEGAKGIYPNCECEDKKAKYDYDRNECAVCSKGCTGTFPNCVCENGADRDSELNQECPYGSTGDYPNCICEDGGTYNKVERLCKSCPGDSTGNYPNCACVKPLGYNRKANRCLECPPENATGVYPFCQCTDNEYIFSAYINECFIPCPKNSEGIHPKCKCGEHNMSYDVEKRDCISTIGRSCPKLSIGIGPDCLCTKYNYDKQQAYEFNKDSWACLPGANVFEFNANGCPDTSQSWPQCNEGISEDLLYLLVGG